MNTKPAPSTSAVPTTSGIETCRPSWSLSNSRNAPSREQHHADRPERAVPDVHLRHHQAGAEQQQQQADPGERHDRDAEQGEHQHQATGERRGRSRRAGDLERDQDRGRRGTGARSGSGRSGRRGSAGAAAACASRSSRPRASSVMPFGFVVRPVRLSQQVGRVGRDDLDHAQLEGLGRGDVGGLAHRVLRPVGVPAVCRARARGCARRRR